MSDNAFLRLDGLKAALSRVKTKVDSDIASAISESTISLTSLISSGDSSTLINAKSYIDGIKTNLDNIIASNLATAKGYTDGAKTALETNITNHKNDTSNPHSVTKTQVGLSNVDNTSDLDKPISTAVQTALNDLEDRIDAIDETGSSITLASLGGASATDLSNHISDTSNPHSVTYSQTGAAAASHTHTEADITDLGSYATNNDLNSYGVSNLSFDNSTSTLTITMKDNTTKTATITGTGNSGSGSSVTLQDLGGASATDLTNHINDTTNPHNVTYSQVGAAASSHTHTTSDISNFGNYANASHTHTEADITDLGNYATNTNLNTYGVKSLSFDNSTGVLTLTMKDDTTKTVTIQVTSGISSSGSGDTPSGTGVSISSATYNTDYKSIEFIMSDNSIINCSLIELIRSIINNDENLMIVPLIYNSEWVDRITGTGTEEDPYLIYTPKDFMSINNDMDGHYKLMNNLDFSNLCGLSVETDDENNSFTITTEDSSAVMYNNGEGYFPIGYNGYYPLNGTEKSTSLFSELTNISNTSKIYGTSATSQYYCFTGELDGNSKVISGIVSNPANTYSVGLFSFLANKAYIHNLTIKDSIFILNDIYCTSNKNSGIGSVTGCITYIDNNTNNRVNISNVYSYSTLISNKSTSGYCSIAGIYSRVTSTNNNGDTAPGCLVNQCSFRGKFMVINPTVSHHIAGIGHYAYWGDSTNRVTNCINTANLKNGSYTQGIGQNLGKVNINCGLLEKYGGEAYSLSGHANTGYVNGKQFTIKDNLQFDTRNSESNNNSYNYYFKTITEIKSQTFINEVNSLSDAPAFIVNDLDFDDSWPLLIDEYDILKNHTNKASGKTNKNELIYEPNAINLSPKYNNDWEDQMTGAGTADDPYLIYTPKDFSMIGRSEDYGLDKYYKLMNNIDFTGLCGIDINVDKKNNSYSIKTTNSSAPLYHSGEGYYPIGYNGYYPTPYVTDSAHPNGYYTPGGDPGPITWEEINEIEEWNSSPTTSNIRGSLGSNNYLLYCFTGKFDGNSKIIKGIRCAPKSTFSVGLFMFLSKDAYIHNLMILDSIFVLPTVWYQWPNNTNRDYYLGAIAGDICKGNISSAYTVNLYRVYSYATLVNDVQINSSYQGSCTGGLIGGNGNQSTIRFRIEECTNRGTIIRTNALDNHIISGIITSFQRTNDNQMIVNCINSSSFTAKWAIGTGYAYSDKININFGIINTYASSINYTTLMAIGGESERTSNAQCYFNEGTPYVFYYSNCPRFYAKSEIFLKSQEFIDEANGYNGTPLLVYNNLGVDNDWPLLIDEYNIIKNFFDNLVIAGFDLETNKLYRSNFPIKNICEKNHTHISSDISDKDIAFAIKNHTHALADITDIGIINVENGIQYSDVSSTNYNNEWVDRMTGTGTQADPHLIYTPKDFMKINDDMTAHYKLMNNLDFTPVIGIMIETSGNSYTSTTVNDTAPLYNNGEGYFPIGYNGYYPLNNSSGEMNSTQHFDSLTSPERFAYNATTYSYDTVYKYGFFGELDGNNKIIKGITCAPVDTYSVGLFHFLGNSAYIHNLTIKDSVFILKGNLAPNGGYSSIGTLAGFVIRDKNSNTFTINDVYTYATLINHETKLGSSSYSYTNGLCGRVLTNPGINYSINRCANHSTFVLITPNVTHVTCGIFLYESDMNGKITNCINTSSFDGYNSHGIGNIAGKVNINCGTITGSNETRPIVKTKNISYTDGKQFVNRSMESYDFYTNETQANQYNIYYKTTAELKSQEFIDEVNALLPEPVFAYNDLNVNDGWPLLINEYNSIVGVDGNLNVSLVDPINNKIYKSGYSLERLQKLVTYRELVSFLEGQISTNVTAMMNNYANNFRIYPLIQRNTSYNVGDKVTLINEPDVYLICIIAGTTDSSENNLVRSEYFTYDNINNTIIDDSDTSELISNNLTNLNIRGCTIRDGSVFWQVCDLNDKHLVGEIIFALNDNLISSEYIPLALPNTYYNSRNLYELKIQNNSIFIKLETFKLIKKLIWSMIKDTTDISVDIDNQSVSLYNNTVSTNSFYLLEFYFENYDQTSLNININSYDASDPNLKILLLFAIYQVIEKSLNNPLTTLQPVSINDIKYSTSSFNSRFNASITNEDYLNFTNNFISDMLSIGTSEEDPENNTKEFYINISFRNINNYFMKIGNESTEQLLQKAGLPNITGDLYSILGDNSDSRTGNGALLWQDTSRYWKQSKEHDSNGNVGREFIHFDASRSNSIYGNSTTVTPQNISLIPYIKL